MEHKFKKIVKKVVKNHFFIREKTTFRRKHTKTCRNIFIFGAFCRQAFDWIPRKI